MFWDYLDQLENEIRAGGNIGVIFFFVVLVGMISAQQIG